MRIGHYCPDIWAPGGVASYIRRLSEEQLRMGHDVMYFDLNRFKNETSTSPEVVTFAETESSLFSLCVKKGLDILHVHVGFEEAIKPILPIIRTVHNHQPYCPSGGRFFGRGETPCPRTYSAGGCTLAHIFKRCGSVRPRKFVEEFRATNVEMKNLRMIPSIAVSNFVKDEMVRAGYPSNLITVVKHPAPVVNVHEQAAESAAARFLFVGRITNKKGVSWLLNAISKVKAPIHLDIAGDGPNKDDMQKLCKELGLDHCVTFHGWLSSSQVNGLLSQCRALVFPSLWHEPAGLVALEAMAHARAIIVSEVGGAQEFVYANSNGLLVKPGDTNGLANAIERLAIDSEYARSLGEAGLLIARNEHALANHMNEVMNLYTRYANEKHIASMAG